MPVPHLRCLSVAILFLALASLLPAQLTQTLPAGFDTADSGSSTAYPQNATADHKWQWHYDSSQFTATGPILITDVAIRSANATDTVGAFSFTNWTVTLIEASTDYQVTGHNTTFAANILTSAVCRTGPWAAGPVPPVPGAPAAPWIPMGLTSGFVYDPTLGNDFIVQIEKCGTPATWGTALDGPIGAAGAIGGNRYGDLANCAALVSTFSNNEFVPVVQITFQTVALIPDDLEVTAITAPVSTPFVCQGLGTNETVSVLLENEGINPIPAGLPIPLVLTLPGGGAPIIEFLTLAAPMITDDTLTFTFAATANLSAPGVHAITVTSLYGADTNPNNDTATVNVTSGGSTITTFPWTENFDSIGGLPGSTQVPPGWTNDPTDVGMSAINGDWIFLNSPTPNAGTGPGADHTTGVTGFGFFAYVNDAGNFASVSLLTPCIDLSTVANPALGFWLHSENGSANPLLNENRFSVDIFSTPGGMATIEVFGPAGPQGPAWTFHSVDLSPWIGQSIRIRFRGQSNGGATVHDLALDDVGVFDAVPGPGQAPQPGLATFDIGQAFDPNGLPVSFGGNGVYQSSVAVGQPIAFEFAGAPNQAIVLLEGPTSAGLANFPGIGQADIGTGLNGITGLPIGINVVANGNLLTLFDFFFRTQASGSQVIVFPMPAIPPGYVTTFQAAMFTGGPTVVALSNAIELFAQ